MSSSSVPAADDRWGARTKRAFDVALAAVGLMMSAPLWVLAAAAIKLEGPGPIFYRQERSGLGGRRFVVLKFRSMIPDAEVGVGPVQAIRSDSRVTAVGRVLRATALDELPQLWNILRGDMSFVGPRALRPREIETLGNGNAERLEDVPGFAERARVRPGLTGVAQIYAPRDVPRRRKFRYDRFYVRRQSLWLDVRLVLLSFWITLRGAWENDGGPVYRDGRRDPEQKTVGRDAQPGLPDALHGDRGNCGSPAQPQDRKSA